MTEVVDGKMANVGYWADLEETPQIPWIDWREKKPHRMLHMSREAFREVRKHRWGARDAEIWRRTADMLPETDARAYDEWRLKLGADGVEKLLNMLAAGWEDLTPERVMRYLTKQDRLHGGVGLLIDYRKMMRALGMEDTPETRWPRRLMEAHDRAAEVMQQRQQHIADEAYLRVREVYRKLEWTDGELRILLPVSENDLRQEGRVLRHCVGGYGPRHLRGELIFFVRKYRRPERSYYTLNIDMGGGAPREIQLHGYGNEYHGEHKQHRHRIPQKVRDFVDRWEREVLTPWWAENRAAKKPRKKKEEKTA